MNGYETYDSTCDVCDACGRGNGAPHTAECPVALAQDEADGTDVTDDEMEEQELRCPTTGESMESCACDEH